MRYATWDLTHVWLVDERTGSVITRIYPLDKHALKTPQGRVGAKTNTARQLADEAFERWSRAL